MLRTSSFLQPARLTGAIGSVVLSSMLVACTGAPPAVDPTAPPDPTPGGSPISSPDPSTPTPASEPTPSPTPQPTGAVGDIDHPTGTTDIILRMEQGGGFVPVGFVVSQVPQFTLYGDGTFIIKPLEDPDLPAGWDSPQPRLLQGQLNEEAIQSLLAFALGPGRLLPARESYEHGGIADASTTIFTIDAGEVSKTVSVYALMESAEPGPDAVDRNGFAQLAELLGSFEQRARSGELGEVVLYEPTHYRLTLLEVFGEPGTEVVDWPWADVTPDDFESVEEFGFPIAILPADQVAELTDVPSGGHPGIFVDYDGTLWQLGVRPLLPEEEPAG